MTKRIPLPYKVLFWFRRAGGPLLQALEIDLFLTPRRRCFNPSAECHHSVLVGGDFVFLVASAEMHNIAGFGHKSSFDIVNLAGAKNLDIEAWELEVTGWPYGAEHKVLSSLALIAQETVTPGMAVFRGHRAQEHCGAARAQREEAKRSKTHTNQDEAGQQPAKDAPDAQGNRSIPQGCLDIAEILIPTTLVVSTISVWFSTSFAHV